MPEGHQSTDAAHADLESRVVDLLRTAHPLRMGAAVRRASALLQASGSQAQVAAALDRAIDRILALSPTGNPAERR